MSCASLDRILVRVNENIKRLVLHFRFINLLHRISILLLVFWGKIKLQIFIIIRITAFREIIYKLIYYIGMIFIEFI